MTVQVIGLLAIPALTPLLVYIVVYIVPNIGFREICLHEAGHAVAAARSPWMKLHKATVHKHILTLDGHVRFSMLVSVPHGCPAMPQKWDRVVLMLAGHATMALNAPSASVPIRKMLSRHVGCSDFTSAVVTARDILKTGDCMVPPWPKDEESRRDVAGCGRLISRFSDKDVERILETCLARALYIVETHERQIREIGDALFEVGTLDAAKIEAMLAAAPS